MRECCDAQGGIEGADKSGRKGRKRVTVYLVSSHSGLRPVSEPRESATNL